MEPRIEFEQEHFAPGHQRVLARLLLVVLVALMAFGGGLASRSPASAQTASLRIDPPSQSVSGQSFTVTIIQTSDSPTLGAQATLQLDPSVVQVTGAEVGAPYVDALFLFGGGAGGAQTPEQAIAEANTTGLLPNITTFLLPGAGSVPPGDAVVATITMSGVAGGASSLNLTSYAAPGGGSDANTLGLLPDPPSDQGTLIPVSVTPGQVTVAGGVWPLSKCST